MKDLGQRVRKIESEQCDIMAALRRIEVNLAPHSPQVPVPVSSESLPLHVYPVSQPVPVPVPSIPANRFTENTHQVSPDFQETIPEPLPLQHSYMNEPLLSEEINRNALLTIEDSLKNSSDL